jgi:23S rRNA (cytosine1962-C5)-methyltransferase
MVTRRKEAPNREFWAARIERALDLRGRVVPGDCRGFRLIFGESDGFPGLVADNYAGHLVVQALTLTAERCLPKILDLLEERREIKSVLARNDPAVRGLEGLPREVRQLRGRTPPEIEVAEGDRRYVVDPWKGQKTGAFLDQRENRVAASNWCFGRVLDAFCYQGDFACCVAPVAGEVIALDSSGPALARGRRAAEANGLDNIDFRQANAFHFLKELDQAGERFDSVILDPPAFARSRADLSAGERAYKEINLRAMRLLQPGGILITSSCSYNLGEGTFLEILGAAAADARRTAQLLERRTQAGDHPVRLGFPESLYLKCLMLSVT